MRNCDGGEAGEEKLEIAAKRNVPGVTAAGDGCLLPCAWEEREGVLGPANTHSSSSVRGSWDKLLEPDTGFSRSFLSQLGWPLSAGLSAGPCPISLSEHFSGKIEFISDIDRRHGVFLGPSVSQTHAASS